MSQRLESTSEQKKGKVKHLGHCFRNARAAVILGAVSLNKEEVEEGLAYAKARRKLLQKEAPALRKVEMRTNPLKAISDGKGAKGKEILWKIHAEDSKTMWFQIGRVLRMIFPQDFFSLSSLVVIYSF